MLLPRTDPPQEEEEEGEELAELGSRLAVICCFLRVRSRCRGSSGVLTGRSVQVRRLTGGIITLDQLRAAAGWGPEALSAS